MPFEEFTKMNIDCKSNEGYIHLCKSCHLYMDMSTFNGDYGNVKVIRSITLKYSVKIVTPYMYTIWNVTVLQPYNLLLLRITITNVTCK